MDQQSDAEDTVDHKEENSTENGSIIKSILINMGYTEEIIIEATTKYP